MTTVVKKFQMRNAAGLSQNDGGGLERELKWQAKHYKCKRKFDRELEVFCEGCCKKFPLRNSWAGGTECQCGRNRWSWYRGAFGLLPVCWLPGQWSHHTIHSSFSYLWVVFVDPSALLSLQWANGFYFLQRRFNLNKGKMPLFKSPTALNSLSRIYHSSINMKKRKIA